jgi:hypothetical protein
MWRHCVPTHVEVLSTTSKAKYAVNWLLDANLVIDGKIAEIFDA